MFARCRMRTSPAFFDMMRQVINDPAVKVVPTSRSGAERPIPPPSSITSDAYRALEAAFQKVYDGIPVLPLMQTGATDMAQLRAKGVQCYGVGPMVDEEDGPKGFGPHSDQERLLEDSVYKHLQLWWTAVTSIAGRNFPKPRVFTPHE